MFFKTLLLIGAGIPLIAGGLSALIFGRKNRSIRVPGLLFHSVLSGYLHPNLSCMSTDRFTAIIKILKHNDYHSIRLSETIAQEQIVNKKNILLTFDDGFQNIAENAIPILDENNYKATIFCVADFVGKSLSWDVYGKSLHMNKLTLRHISDSGHEIGSHTCSHVNLPYLSDSDLRYELTSSKEKLEDITGRPVTSLSFPFGGWNYRTWNAAKEAGYTAATIYRNHNFPLHSNLFPVYGIYQFDTPSTVLAKINTHSLCSIVKATAVILSQFSKGSPVWLFRSGYTHLPY
jgi:peptidoglycan/xylan/chitin deacetylase (PgdA/CDA1 family)